MIYYILLSYFDDIFRLQSIPKLQLYKSENYHIYMKSLDEIRISNQTRYNTNYLCKSKFAINIASSLHKITVIWHNSTHLHWFSLLNICKKVQKSVYLTSNRPKSKQVQFSTKLTKIRTQNKATSSILNVRNSELYCQFKINVFDSNPRKLEQLQCRNILL